MSNFTHELAAAGLKRRNPLCSEAEVRRLLVEILYFGTNKRP
ncbi:MAG TPA: hypothetical protein VNA69_10380 [Thermoanaerobaculia bacterium]|nr:hypothetical protein [Thermoanaerobaculia bacterium]